MTAKQYWEHKMKEGREKQRMALKKLSNNPILTEECRYVMHQAMININLLEFYRNAYIELREQYDRDIKRSKPYQSGE